MKAICALMLAVLVSACAAYDGYSLRAGVSTEAEARQVMGKPAMELRNPDGSRQLVYPRGPLGGQTFMVDVRSDGVVSAVRQVLTDETFYRINRGLTRDEVLRLIGPPGDVMEFPRLQQVSYEYRYVDTWGYDALFSVNFDRNGIVVSKFTRRIERDDGRDR